jgi:hypothetical protein
MIKDAASFSKNVANPDSRQTADCKGAATTRTVGDILWNGTDKELQEALKQLPDGHCDLTECMLKRTHVEKLVAALQHVEVHRISFGLVEEPEILLNAIPHSLVHEWNFFDTTRLGSNSTCFAFPNAGEVTCLATAISQLNEHSSTKLIYINAKELDDAAQEQLPACFKVSSWLLRLADKAPSLTQPSPVLLNADKTGLSEQQYAKVFFELTSAIGRGDVTAIRSLVKEKLPGCPREHFELFQQSARLLANLGTAARTAAQEILKLTFPVSAEPQEQLTPPGLVPSGHPAPLDAPKPPQGNTVNLTDLLLTLPKYISNGSSRAPNPLCSADGQLLPLSASQKDALRGIAKNYLFDDTESVQALAHATLDLLENPKD